MSEERGEHQLMPMISAAAPPKLWHSVEGPATAPWRCSVEREPLASEPAS